MTLKEFIQGKNVTAYEVVNNNLIINVVIEESSHGLDVDTSSVSFGTPVVRITNFILEGDTLTVNNLTINTNDINMLSSNKN